MTNSRRTLTTDFGLLALAGIWGVNFSVVKIVLDELEPLALNALRFPLAVLALAIVLQRSPGPRYPSREDLPRIVALGLLGNVAYQLCFIYGIDWTGAGNASLLLSTTPAWTVLMSSLAGHERPTPWVGVGIFATLIGMALVVLGRGDTVTLGIETLRGDLLLVIASILWSTYTVASRNTIAHYGALRMTAWTLYVGTPLLILLGIPSLTRTDLASVSWSVWAGVAYAGFLSIGLAYLLWYRGVQALGNNRTAVYSNLVPVAALFTAWLWLGEVPAQLQLLGAAIVLAGLTVARLAQPPVAPSPDPSGSPSSDR
jgi:drug/metabolite transporter (DMT)-like permease